ncbi:unnamed protein product, partial [Ectocarpus sp. 12 AP-2014]
GLSLIIYFSLHAKTNSNGGGIIGRLTSTIPCDGSGHDGPKHRQTMRAQITHTQTISLRALTQKLRSPSTPSPKPRAWCSRSQKQSLAKVVAAAHAQAGAHNLAHMRRTPIGFIRRESPPSHLFSRFSRVHLSTV